MVIQTKIISEDKIKLRWNEPYVSEASDIQASVNSPGVYRGGFLKESLSPNQFFRVTKDSDVDTALLHFNSSSGIATVMRLDSDELIDMSSEFPILADTVWYVYASVSYVSGSLTTASIEVSDVMPSGDEIMLGAIFMPSGALTILDSYVRTDGVYRRLPSSRRGMIIPKSVRVPALAGRTEFQISDRVYLYNNGSITDMANARVKLYDDLTDSFKPLMGIDGGQIRVARVTETSGGASPVPFSSLDSDGCFSDPFVIMDFTHTSDTVYAGQFYANYWAYCEIDEIPTGFAAEGNIFHGVHATDVFTRALTPTPSPTIPLVPTVLSNVLLMFMNFIAHKVDINQQPAVSTGWDFVWRSHNGVGSANSIQMYWRDGEVAIVVNGSLTSAGLLSPFSNGDPVRMWTFGVAYGCVKAERTTVMTVPFDAFVQTNWDSYERLSLGGQKNIYNTPRVVFDDYPTISIGTSTAYRLLLELTGSGQQLRVYSGDGLRITANAEWSVASSNWRSDDNLSPAYSLDISPNHGIRIRIKIATVSTWLDTTGLTGWTTRYSLSDSDSASGLFNNCFTADRAYELVRVCMAGRRPNDLITATAYCPLNWRNKRKSAPSSIGVNHTYFLTSGAVVAIQDVDEWGARAYGYKNASAAATYDVSSVANTSQIHVDSTTAYEEIAPGDLVKLNSGDGNAGTYIVIEAILVTGTYTLVKVRGNPFTPASYSPVVSLERFEDDGFSADIAYDVE